MIHSTLDRYYFFYQLLKEQDKIKFQQRVQDFIKGRVFIPRNNSSVTNEVKVLIAASAIQVTFGLDKYMLPHFNTILVYPTSYYSHITRRYHKGEVNLQGAVVISWEDLLEGIKRPFDAFHVGIHEFAHALYFENFIENEEYLYLDKSSLKKWYDLAHGLMPQIRDNLHSFIREYANHNLQEFFAVSVEYFFEKPFEFERELPELYLAMKSILNFDVAELYSGVKT